ncbi:MAG TPA: hypothetical protein VGO68_16400 [Pyrinomonadaceae bacterium]|jgi:hypothetical protein|nr:hypothetical protein [Pyrinomonadaceae bacterium]
MATELELDRSDQARNTPVSFRPPTQTGSGNSYTGTAGVPPATRHRRADFRRSLAKSGIRATRSLRAGRPRSQQIT